MNGFARAPDLAKLVSAKLVSGTDFDIRVKLI